ncbi:RNA polymerase sigma factor RpoE [Lysobacteraceae bacterium NML120232]|nr:RNA polymerase sigma factor RpoE [Xanthomonadaceae bacterium NML120232]
MLDAELVRRVQQGDAHAFELLVRRYQHRMVALAARYVGEWAEDVAQDAFIRAYRAIGNFRGDASFHTWLHRITVNTAKNHLVAMKRRPPAADVDVADAEHFDAELLGDADTPERELMRHQIEQAVMQAMQALPRELNQAIRLRELDGLSYEDIARQLGCPVGTVRSRIFRAREAIDRALRPLVDGSATARERGRA